MGFSFEKVDSYAQKVIDKDELNNTINRLNNAIKSGNYKQNGWGAVENILSDYKFSSDSEKEHMLEQIKLMLKLWGTGTHGKYTVASIIKACIEHGERLDNIGHYVLGAKIMNRNGEVKVGGKPIEIKATNPVILWLNEYWKKNNLNQNPKSSEIIPNKIEHKEEDKPQTPPDSSSQQLTTQENKVNTNNLNIDDIENILDLKGQLKLSDIWYAVNQMKETGKGEEKAFIEYFNKLSSDDKRNLILHFNYINEKLKITSIGEFIRMMNDEKKQEELTNILEDLKKPIS